jgi:hypothetical protein
MVLRNEKRRKLPPRSRYVFEEQFREAFRVQFPARATGAEAGTPVRFLLILGYSSNLIKF